MLDAYMDGYMCKAGGRPGLTWDEEEEVDPTPKVKSVQATVGGKKISPRIKKKKPVRKLPPRDPALVSKYKPKPRRNLPWPSAATIVRSKR